MTRTQDTAGRNEAGQSGASQNGASENGGTRDELAGRAGRSVERGMGRTVSLRQTLYAATMLVPLVGTVGLGVGKVALRHWSAPSLVEEAQAQSVRLPTPNSLNAPAPTPGNAGAASPTNAAPIPPPPGPSPTVQATAPATPAGPRSAVGVLLEQANYWRNQAQYDQATESLNRALALDPRNPDALALSGQLNADRGNRAAAENALARLRQASPSDPRIDKIDQALRVGPIPQEALTDARKLARDGRQVEAVDRYNRVFRGNPPPDALSVEYYQTLAGTEGGWEKARDGLARTVRQNPQDLRAQLAYAQILTYREGARTEGIARLSALSRNPAVADQATQAWRQALGWLPENSASVEPLTIYLQNHPNDSEVANKLQTAKNPPAATAADPTATDRIAGFEALNKGRLAEAQALFQKAIEANAQDADATGGLGIVKLRQKNLAEAKTLLGHAIELDPDHKARWQSAYNAAANPRQAGPAGPVDPTGGLLQQGSSQARAGRLGEAETAYRQALSRQPNNPGALTGLADVLAREGRTDEANALLAQAEAAGARGAGQTRGQVLRQQAQAVQDPLAQLGLYQQAAAADPSSPWIKLDLARALVKLRRLGEARAVMADAVSGRPSADALKAGIIFANETNDPQAANALYAQLPPSARTADLRPSTNGSAAIQQDIAQAVALSPQLARPRLLSLAGAAPDPDGSRGAAVARALSRMGDKSAARDAILVAQSATRGQPQAAKIAYAGAFLEIGLTDDAANMLGSINERSLTPAQRSDYASVTAGFTVRSSDQLNQRGRTADAYDLLSPALQQNPDNPALNMALARLYQTAKNPREALEINEGLLRRDPGNVDARRAAVEAALAKGDRSKADQLVQEGLQLNPNDPKAWITAANFEKARGNNSRALRSLARARELRLQQLGYSDNGADRVPGVSLSPGGPVSYAPPVPSSRFRLSADGGDDNPTPRAYAQNGYGTNAYSAPSTFPPNLYPDGVTPPPGRAAPAARPAATTPAGYQPPTGRVLDTQATDLPPPRGAAPAVTATPLAPIAPSPAPSVTAQSADQLNGNALRTPTPAPTPVFQSAPAAYRPPPVAYTPPPAPVATYTPPPQPVYAAPVAYQPAYQPTYQPSYQSGYPPPPNYPAPTPPGFQPAPTYSPNYGAPYTPQAGVPPQYQFAPQQQGYLPQYAPAQEPAPRVEPTRTPRFDTGGGPFGRPTSVIAENPNAGYYSNPFRRGSATPPGILSLGDNGGSTAGAAVGPRASADPVTEEIDKNIVSLRDEVAPTATGGFGFRSRSGDSGLDKLTELTIPLEATFSPGGYGKLKLAATPTILESGSIGGNVTNLQRYGTEALSLQAPTPGSGVFTPSFSGKAPASQHAEGIGLDLGYSLNDRFSADVGTTPIGYRITNVVGGVEFAPKVTDRATLRLTGERRAITDSILSYAGTVDPRSGLKWGAVTRTRGRANLEFSSGNADFYVGGGGGAINGTHVQSNTEVEAGAGGSYPVYRNDTQEVRVGVDLVYFGYSKNLRFFTLGQGGYFSPQSYYAALVPVVYREKVDEDLSYEVGGAIGIQSYHENASLYYPKDPALQAQLVATQAGTMTAISGVQTSYPARSQSGFSGNAHALIDYRVAPNLHLGGRATYQHAGNFDEATALVYARYLFNGTANR